MGVMGIGSLVVAYGGALSICYALFICCIAPFLLVYTVYPHNTDINSQELPRLSDGEGKMNCHSST
jgi:hypothetical protein